MIISENNRYWRQHQTSKDATPDHVIKSHFSSAILNKETITIPNTRTKYRSFQTYSLRSFFNLNAYVTFSANRIFIS